MHRRPDLPFAEVTEYGVHFKTGLPVRFHYLRYTEKAPDFGSRFQQDIEPAGFYVVHNPNPGDLPRGWRQGWLSFKHPLVIALNTGSGEGGIYDEHSWKAALHRAYGKTGRSLSLALIRDGYDGIVTATDVDTREIVALRVVSPGGVR